MLGFNYLVWIGIVSWVVVPLTAFFVARWLWRRSQTDLSRLLALVAGLAIFLTPAAISNARKAYYDRQVRELCAKDGGVRVYEKVTLPAKRFDEWGNVDIPNKRYAKPENEYYFESEDHYYRHGNPKLLRMNTRVIRKGDEKILGESVRYARSGGDLPGPWHGSSYGCPPLPMKLASSIFLESGRIVNNSTSYFEQAQLAFAAYFTLAPGMTRDDYELALRDDGDGMSPTQATIFASSWKVVDQYTDPVTGVSATIFQAVSGGPKYLAIRGTDGLDDIGADIDLAAGVPMELDLGAAA